MLVNGLEYAASQIELYYIGRNGNDIIPGSTGVEGGSLADRMAVTTANTGKTG